MALINAFRMNGLGNNFIIVDRRKNSINISKEKIIELGQDPEIYNKLVNSFGKQMEKLL